ncbi:MAG TPA: type II toxin-antitoxin system PemK/MazF family toxin [Bdellovibrionota bacterium]|nr:type II toxin-antitoxin system PemK/MazF family toxin [Bdellovibrionota bacterium]
MDYKRFDIVVLPFPFSDQLNQKRRPVVIISSDIFNSQSGHFISAMITTAKKSSWPFDTEIKDLKSSGLYFPCFIRMKLFTADKRMVAKRIGHLAAVDQKALINNLKSAFE